MGKAKQLSFLKPQLKQFGGTLLKGNPKTARPLSTRHAIHLVLKSKLAQGARSFLNRKNSQEIETIIRRQAELWHIRLYHTVNVGNHLHLVLRIKPGHAVGASASTQRRATKRPHSNFVPFIRAVTGLIARHVLGAEKGSPKDIQFWQARPFTRIISWGRDWDHIKNYMGKNRSQAGVRAAFVDWGFGVTSARAITGLNTC